MYVHVLGSCSAAMNESEQKRQEQSGGLLRRHSFSLIGTKENCPAPSDSSSVWYNDDEHAVHHKKQHAAFDENGFSDSEGGFQPFKNRLRGLFGSFGKGKRRPAVKRRVDHSADSALEIAKVESPMLKATLGEFTRQIESLSAQNENEPPASSSNGTFYTARVVARSSPSVSINKDAISAPVIMRAKHDLVKSVSVDGGGRASNRDSVVSAISSESFGGHDDSDVDRDEVDNNGRRKPATATNSTGTSNSSPRSAEDVDLSPKQRQDKKVFYIAREIMTSERVFVDILRLLNVEFREFVQNARRDSKSGIMPDADFSRIFSNLPELQTLNEDLLQDFEDRIGRWENVRKIADVIVKKGPFLKLYTSYIREFSSVNYHFDDCCHKYAKFGKLVKEFEKLDRCRNLKLKHFMLKPVQRLPQYRLLLEDYLKHLETDSPDFDDTTNALRIVSEAAEHANDTIKQGDQFRKMLKLQSRLGDMEFIRPGRELIKEGELQKISRKGIGPRYFVLLSDCLLYCTYSGSSSNANSGLRVTYKIPLTTLQVRHPNADEFQTEFNIASPVRSCTLRASSVQERNDWLEAMNSAIEDHVNRKATFNIASNEPNGNGPEEVGKLGNSAPVWVPDRRVTMCQNCGAEFSVLVRRHHCRACGKVVCSTCSANKAPLRYRDFEVARVCDDCFEVLEKGNH